MPYSPDKYAKDLNGGYRARRVISASATDIAEDLRAPAFMVSESGNYTIKLDAESAAVQTPLLSGAVYGFWLAAFTAGPSGASRVHLLYPETL